MSRHKAKISALEQELAKSASKVQIANNVIEELKIQNKKTLENRAEYEDKLKDINMKLQGEKVQNSVHRDVIASMSPQIEKLKCENECHESNLSHLKEKLAFTESELAKKKNESESRRSRVNSLERKLEESKELTTRLQSTQVSTIDLDKVKQQLDAKTAESDNLAVDLIGMTDKSAELEKMLAAVSAELEIANEDRNGLRSLYEEQKETVSTLRDKLIPADEIQTELNANLIKCEELQRKLDEANLSLSNMAAVAERRQNEATEAEVTRKLAAQLEEELADLQKVNKSLQSKIVDMELAGENLQHKLNISLGTKGETSDHLNSALATCKDLSGKLEISEARIQTIIKEQDALTERHRDEIAQHQSRQAQLVKSANTKDTEYQDNLAELQALVIGAASDLKAMVTENAELTEKLKCSRANLNSVDSINKKLQSELSKLKEKLSSQNAMSISMKSQIANLDSELSHANHANETTLDLLKKQIYSLTHDKSSLQTRNDKLVIEVDKILTEKQIYIDEIEQLASELKNNKSDALEKEKKSLSTIDDLNQRLMSAHAQLDKHTDSKSERHLESADISTELIETTAKNSRLQAELDAAGVELTEVQQHRDKLLDTLQAKEEKEDFQDQYSKLRQQCSEQRVVIDDLLLSSKVTEDKHQRLENQLSEMKIENTALQTQLQCSEEELADFQQDVEEQRNKNIYLANKQAEKHKVEISTLQETLADIRSEWEELKRQNSLLKNSYDELKPQSVGGVEIEQLRLENKRLEQIFESLQYEHLDHLSSSSAEVCILQAQLDNMNEVVEKLRKELKLKENLQTLSSELQNRLREEKKAHLETTEELQSIKTEQLTFKEQLQDLTEKHEHSQQKCEELQSDIRQIEDQAKHDQGFLETRLAEKQTENMQLTTQVEELRSTVNKLQLNVDETQKLSIENHKLQTSLAEALEQNQNIALQLEAKEAKIKDLSDAKDRPATNEHLDVLKEQLGDQKAMCNLAKAAVALTVHVDENVATDCQAADSSQDDYIGALQSEIRMLSDQLAFTKRENDDLSGRTSDLYDRLSEMSAEVKNVENIRRQLTETISKRDQLKEQLSASLEKIDELKDRWSSLESQNRLLKNEVAENKAQHNRLQMETAKREKKLLDQELLLSSLQLESNVMQEAVSEPATSENKISEQLTSSPASEVDVVDYKVKFQQAQNQIGVLEFDYESMEARLQQVVDSNSEMDLQIMALKGERDQLAAQMESSSPSLDEANKIEDKDLQKQIIDLKQQLSSLSTRTQSLETEKFALDQQLLEEQEITKDSVAEVEKLQMSINLLMSSHETEMSSLQNALHDATANLTNLEKSVSSYAQHCDKLRSVATSVANELSDLKASKDALVSLINNLIAQNNNASSQFQQQLCIMIEQLACSISAETVNDNRAADLSDDSVLHTTLGDSETNPISSTPLANITSSITACMSSIKTESMSTVSHYGQLSKEDLVVKLSEQTKHELLLRKHLEDARQSLVFYRSAIDNIIDCLGTAMPDVKKWASDFLNVSMEIDP